MPTAARAVLRSSRWTETTNTSRSTAISAFRETGRLTGLSFTVRLMFDAFYGTVAVAWVTLLGYLAFRFFVPALAL